MLPQTVYNGYTEYLKKKCDENQIPEDWKKGIIVPIFQKETKRYVATTEELHYLAKVSKYMRGYWPIS